MPETRLSPSAAHWRRQLHEIIFEADTAAGKTFDVVLLIMIVLSTLVVTLESMATLRLSYGQTFIILEWFFTVLFTIEYFLRLISVRRPLRYMVSFFDLVDILAIVPTYLGLLIPSNHYLLVIRVIRLLQIFRVLKLAEHLREAAMLQQALLARASLPFQAGL